jgi:hypothetical protein
MDRAEHYLRIPFDYSQHLGGLGWSPGADELVYPDGRTFAFTPELVKLLEGFTLQRPLIHFGHILHLLALLRGGPELPARPRFAFLLRAYRQTGQSPRRAGAFFGMLCRDLPPVPESPSPWEVWLCLFPRPSRLAAFIANQPLRPAEIPPYAPLQFEEWLHQALARQSDAEVLHWLRHGQEPVEQAGTELAQPVLPALPPSLREVLGDLAQQPRLSGAIPFVGQLVSALELPPRRLGPQELPLGGYADVCNRGQPEQLLPGQFALDELEFLRRHAERELLYFRRADPQARPREELVVLLDQGVRTWGRVRLVLAAGLFALGQLAQRRRLAFRLAVTSDGGASHDPVTMDPSALGQLVQTSDLSPHPALALERLLQEDAGTPRDVVLLTHPFSLAESDVRAAARCLRPDCRLFAVSVNDHGEVQMNEIRHGEPLLRLRFRISWEVPAPATPARPAAKGSSLPWRGAVEPVGFPFCFGVRPLNIVAMDFDHSGEWLFFVISSGYLFAQRTDGSRHEILPRGMYHGEVLSKPLHLVGVAGGCATVGMLHDTPVVFYYNLGTRSCTSYPQQDGRSLQDCRLIYYRDLHTLIVAGREGCFEIDLAPRPTDTLVSPRPRSSAALARIAAYDHPKPYVAVETADPHAHTQVVTTASIPAPEAYQVHLAPEVGLLTLYRPRQPSRTLIPQADGQPALKGCRLQAAQLQGQVLALRLLCPLESKRDVPQYLLLLHITEGRILGEYQLLFKDGLALSEDGRLFARQLQMGQLEVRSTQPGSAPLCVTSTGGYHDAVVVELGECWLAIANGVFVYLTHWEKGRLQLHAQRQRPEGASSLGALLSPLLQKLGLPRESVRASKNPRFPDYDPQRFVQLAAGGLLAAVDCFGQVALFEYPNPQSPVCMFFTFGNNLAAWMPDGTCVGHPSLLVGKPTPDAQARIGQALLAAWKRSAEVIA